MDQNSNCLLVFCTCPDDIAAGRLAERLVERKLAACVNILPAVKSVFYWQGKLENEQETLLLIKTIAARFGALRDWLTEAHPYDNPEIIALDVVAGAKPYLDWVTSACNDASPGESPDA